ncbi:hypothetical protein CLV51_104143 [Chitinophaga niastensis]|uniref:Uncharacterized protein n=1 Tax=Chitinophaga niastensis TaxID=536980 RepID=A0A2P8HGU8_CHINA|nr:hypothetical protein CLV51_104143 [Chitinophaga niastensis]
MNSFPVFIPKQGEKRAYLDCKRLKAKKLYQNKWDVFDRDENAAIQE